MNISSMSIGQLRQHYLNKDFTPEELIDKLLSRAEQFKDYHSWIYLLDKAEIQSYSDALKGQKIAELPLYGIPFAIKDNIDLAHVPTTAACEAFSYIPEKSAFVVQRLISAGAIPIGKTNLDQFATGLVGTRSPYGAVKNSLNPEWISGGSSSGSAVAVAQGLVSFALGTDTAGSGRIPAAFNNIIGLKPSRGLFSNQGVVPACQSLDCVAVFTTSSQDLPVIFNLLAQYDAQDPFSRRQVLKTTAVKKSFTFAVPKTEQLNFFANEVFQQQFMTAVDHMEKLGGKKQTIDFQPFIQAAKLLYEGPWVTERYLAVQPLIDTHPEAFLDVIHQIIVPGKAHKASDVFSSLYQLKAYKQQTDTLLSEVDFLLTPTAGTIYSIDEVNNDPIRLNSNLGYYTNYMNLLDYCAIALPAGLTEDNTPFGISLVGKTFADQQLMVFAKMWQQSLSLTLGATQWHLPTAVQAMDQSKTEADRLKLVVCGAHLSGLGLNHQLLERDATLIKACQSASFYKLFALPGGPPNRPGLMRQSQAASAIDVELWSIPLKNLGSFLSTIPHPLGLGKVELEDGSWETGFICEAYIENEAEDISHFGGWRNYLEHVLS